jgi:DNA-binding response OmpR family regulator
MPNMSGPGLVLTTPLALITYQRHYRALSIIPALLELGFTVTERPHDQGSDAMAAELRPALIVLVADTRPEEALPAVQRMARTAAAMLVVLGASDHAGADYYRAGADLFLRESDGDALLLAQLRAAWRRIRQAARTSEEPIHINQLEIDRQRRSVTWRGDAIRLSPTEFRVLTHLALHTRKVVPPGDLMRATHEYETTEREAREAAKVFIRRIRHKMCAACDGECLITTVRGFGYILDVPDDEQLLARHAGRALPVRTEAPPDPLAV